MLYAEKGVSNSENLTNCLKELLKQVRTLTREITVSVSYFTIIVVDETYSVKTASRNFARNSLVKVARGNCVHKESQ